MLHNFSFLDHLDTCGGLTLTGCQKPTQLLSHSLLSWTEEENRMEKFLGWDKHREITHQLLPQGKQTQLWEA